MSYTFKLVLGDWSGDGHGGSETYLMNSSKSIEAVREAFFKAREIVPTEIHPENICSDYKESTVSPGIVKQILDFYNLHDFEDEWFQTYFLTEAYMELDILAEITARFINMGDPECNVQISPEQDSMPTLHFYGTDEKQRHIGFIGYGITGV